MSLLNFFANTAAKQKLNFELNECKLLPNETLPTNNGFITHGIQKQEGYHASS